MKTEVLSVANIYGPSLERLEREFTVYRLWQAPDRDRMLADVGPRIRGMQASGFARVDDALLARLPRLEIISCFGVGYDGIDVAAAKRRNIIVTNTPEVLNDCVADLAIGLMVAAARRLCEGDRYVRAGKWLAAPLPLARKVSGKRLGILGLGRIGRTIARRAAAFDMQIAYHSRQRVPDVAFQYHDRLVDLARA